MDCWRAGGLSKHSQHGGGSPLLCFLQVRHSQAPTKYPCFRFTPLISSRTLCGHSEPRKVTNDWGIHIKLKTTLFLPHQFLLQQLRFDSPMNCWNEASEGVKRGSGRTPKHQKNSLKLGCCTIFATRQGAPLLPVRLLAKLEFATSCSQRFLWKIHWNGQKKVDIDWCFRFWSLLKVSNAFASDYVEYFQFVEYVELKLFSVFEICCPWTCFNLWNLCTIYY